MMKSDVKIKKPEKMKKEKKKIIKRRFVKRLKISMRE